MALSNDDILLALWINRHREKKELKKYILKLMEKGIPSQHYNFLMMLVKAPKDAAAEIEALIDDIENETKMLTEYYKQGFQGSVDVGNVMYPISITFEEEGDQQWANENEEQVALAIAHATRKALNRERIICDISLFPNYGFSGQYMKFDVKRTNPLQTRVKALN